MDNDTQREPTKGEKAVRRNFNPSGNPLVEEVKARYAEIIDLLEDQLTNDPEADRRVIAIAQTKAEEGAMWAVKAVTK